MFEACEGGEEKGCQRQQNMVFMGLIYLLGMMLKVMEKGSSNMAKSQLLDQ
jgi:hypothetical protein